MKLSPPALALALVACGGNTCTVQSLTVLPKPDAGATAASATSTTTDASPPSPQEHTSFGGGFPGGDSLLARAEDLPGGPHAVDALALLSKAREVAGVGEDVGLKGLVVRHVGSSGLVDLAPTTYEARIEYWYIKKAALPDAGTAPIGASSPQHASAKEWIVHVVAGGMRAPAKQNISGSIPDAVPPPHCPLSRLWASAIRAGAPKDAVAVLSYGYADPFLDNEHHGWVFSIEGTEFMWNMSDKTCEIEGRSSHFL
jgi:hypothetical protein